MFGLDGCEHGVDPAEGALLLVFDGCCWEEEVVAEVVGCRLLGWVVLVGLLMAGACCRDDGDDDGGKNECEGWSFVGWYCFCFVFLLSHVGLMLCFCLQSYEKILLAKLRKKRGTGK